MSFKCDTPEAWENIHNSNMSKTPGVNLTRPNNFSLPDMVKGKDFKKPDIKKLYRFIKTTY